MPQYRVIITQTREYYLDIEAASVAEAEGLAERMCEDESGLPSLPDPETDHDTRAECRTCGEHLNAGLGGDGEAEGLPGYCGPCSIPEQQDRDRGRSSEPNDSGRSCNVCGDSIPADALLDLCEDCRDEADRAGDDEPSAPLLRDPAGLAEAFEAVGRVVALIPVHFPDALRQAGAL